MPISETAQPEPKGRPGAAEGQSSPLRQPGRPRARSVLAHVEAALFVAAALLSLAFYLNAPSALPSEDDYRQAARAIAARAGPGDAVLLDPYWAERARLFVRNLPVLNLGRHPTREDLRGYGRIFAFLLPDLPRSSPERAFRFLTQSRFRRVEEPKRYGAIAVALFENTQVERPSFDFTGEVARAKVYIRRSDGSEDVCPPVAGRHPCPRASWINVGPEIKEIAFKPQRCLWAHPAGREPLVVEYPEVPLGRSLDVMGGIVGQIVFRREHYATVSLDVKIDGALAAQLDFPPGELGERRRSIDTAPFAGGLHRVQFEISAPDPSMRHFCFDAGVYP